MPGGLFSASVGAHVSTDLRPGAGDIGRKQVFPKYMEQQQRAWLDSPGQQSPWARLVSWGCDLGSHPGTHAQKGPMLDLMLCCQFLKVLNSFLRGMGLAWIYFGGPQGAQGFFIFLL